MEGVWLVLECLLQTLNYVKETVILAYGLQLLLNEKYT